MDGYLGANCIEWTRTGHATRDFSSFGGRTEHYLPFHAASRTPNRFDRRPSFSSINFFDATGQLFSLVLDSRRRTLSKEGRDGHRRLGQAELGEGSVRRAKHACSRPPQSGMTSDLLRMIFDEGPDGEPHHRRAIV